MMRFAKKFSVDARGLSEQERPRPGARPARNEGLEDATCAHVAIVEVLVVEPIKLDTPRAGGHGGPSSAS